MTAFPTRDLECQELEGMGVRGFVFLHAPCPVQHQSRIEIGGPLQCYYKAIGSSQKRKLCGQFFTMPP